MCFTSANPACKSLLPNQPDTFVLPAQYAYGNLGRNTLRDDRLVQLDMSLIKGWRFTESKNVEFRAQVFNLTNTAQFGQPGATVTSATFNPDGSVKALNGYTQITSASNERQLRFALKLSF